jgi:hypothetical protein
MHSWGVEDSIQAPSRTPMLSSQAGYSSVSRASDVETCSNQMAPGSIPCIRTSTQCHRHHGTNLLLLSYGASLATSKSSSPVISEDSPGQVRPGMACTMVCRYLRHSRSFLIGLTRSSPPNALGRSGTIWDALGRPGTL